MLPGNSSMPVQQITVVPARETASNGKTAPRSKEKNEVSFRLLNSVLTPLRREPNLLSLLFCRYFCGSELKVM